MVLGYRLTLKSKEEDSGTESKNILKIDELELALKVAFQRSNFFGLQEVTNKLKEIFETESN